MTTINLLPWRETLREERKQEFFVSLGVVVAIAAVMLFLVDRYFNSEVNGQQRVNDYLSEQITVLDAEIVEIRDLQAQRTALTERMAVIQDLQGTRPIIVRLFDELVKTLPTGVYYNTVSRNDNRIQMSGIAESNNKVSELMRALEASDWFANASLQQINAQEDGDADGTYLFQLELTVTAPVLEVEE
ncbi:MAG: pilus assembly protein PilN [SAR86 cluster bacterium]|uniref:Pilus assembly protein PilN n=1 Tax=SAR86 cluster bacterium TaxID=2030880 RepID=A0A2A5CK10_9GAMM|nr:PilN domain-containing protein [Gammaproteobacteria bacterium AH-315-E17]PCJ43750.1 MAG: pilus assembly protein PilN [SAR86 cluster bacterium]